MIYLMLAGLMLITLFMIILIEIRGSLHLLYIIPSTLFFFMGVYYFYDSVLGYPAKKVLTTEFQLLSYKIHPDETEIYLWVSLLDEEKPLSVIIPYSSEDHESLEKYGKMMEEGMLVEGIMDEGDEGDGDESESEGESGLGTNKSRGGMLSLQEINQYKFLEKKN